MLLTDVKRLLPDPLRIVILGETCTVDPDIPVDIANKVIATGEQLMATKGAAAPGLTDLLYSLLSQIIRREPRTWWQRLRRQAHFTPAQLRKGMGMATMIGTMTMIQAWLNHTSVDIAREAVENPLKAAVR